MYAVWFAAVFVGTFLPLYPFFLILLSHKSGYWLANILRKLWALLIMLFTGIWIVVEKESKSKIPSPCVFVANHSSYLDILSLALVANGNYMFMAKQELMKIPLFRVFFRTVDIGVNRSSSVDAAKAYKRTVNRIKEGYNVVIFPEGTIGTQVPNLRNFKDGAFKLAIDTEIPIVPVTLLDNWKRLSDKKGWSGSPGLMRVYLHRPIETKGLNKEEVSSLKSKVYTIIENKLIEKKIIKSL